MNIKRLSGLILGMAALACALALTGCGRKNPGSENGGSVNFIAGVNLGGWLSQYAEDAGEEHFKSFILEDDIKNRNIKQIQI
jgi:hypothetical protein